MTELKHEHRATASNTQAASEEQCLYPLLQNRTRSKLMQSVHTASTWFLEVSHFSPYLHSFAGHNFTGSFSQNFFSAYIFLSPALSWGLFQLNIFYTGIADKCLITFWKIHSMSQGMYSLHKGSENTRSWIFQNKNVFSDTVLREQLSCSVYCQSFTSHYDNT